MFIVTLTISLFTVARKITTTYKIYLFWKRGKLHTCVSGFFMESVTWTYRWLERLRVKQYILFSNASSQYHKGARTFSIYCTLRTLRIFSWHKSVGIYYSFRLRRRRHPQYRRKEMSPNKPHTCIPKSLISFRTVTSRKRAAVEYIKYDV